MRHVVRRRVVCREWDEAVVEAREFLARASDMFEDDEGYYEGRPTFVFENGEYESSSDWKVVDGRLRASSWTSGELEWSDETGQYERRSRHRTVPLGAFLRAEFVLTTELAGRMGARSPDTFTVPTVALIDDHCRSKGWDIRVDSSDGHWGLVHDGPDGRTHSMHLDALDDLSLEGWLDEAESLAKLIEDRGRVLRVRHGEEPRGPGGRRPGRPGGTRGSHPLGVGRGVRPLGTAHRLRRDRGVLALRPLPVHRTPVLQGGRRRDRVRCRGEEAMRDR